MNGSDLGTFDSRTWGLWSKGNLRRAGGDQPEAQSWSFISANFLSLGAFVKLISEAAINMRPRTQLCPAREATKFQNVPGRNRALAWPASRDCKTLPNESSPGAGWSHLRGGRRASGVLQQP